MPDRRDRTVIRRPHPGRRGDPASRDSDGEAQSARADDVDRDRRGRGVRTDGEPRPAARTGSRHDPEADPGRRSRRNARGDEQPRRHTRSERRRKRAARDDDDGKKRRSILSRLARDRGGADGGAWTRNPFLEAGGDLLVLASRLRPGADIEAEQLFETTVDQVVEMQRELSYNRDMDPDDADRASYVICAAVDEAVYVGAGGWRGQETLCSRFHGNLLVGEEFFVLLEDALRRPERNRQFLELQLVCLRLGFEGVHGTPEGRGRSHLNELEEDIHDTLRASLPSRGEALSARWEPSDVIGNKLTNTVPWWAVLWVGLLLVAGTFTFYFWDLSNRADAIVERASVLSRSDPTVTQAILDSSHLAYQEPKEETPKLTLAEFLKPEVGRRAGRARSGRRQGTHHHARRPEESGFHVPLGQRACERALPRPAGAGRQCVDGHVGPDTDHRIHRQRAHPHCPICFQLGAVGRPREGGVRAGPPTPGRQRAKHRGDRARTREPSWRQRDA